MWKLNWISYKKKSQFSNIHTLTTLTTFLNISEIGHGDL